MTGWVAGWLVARVVGAPVGTGQSSDLECDGATVEVRIGLLSMLVGAVPRLVPSGMLIMPVSVGAGTMALPLLVPSGMLKMSVSEMAGLVTAVLLAVPRLVPSGIVALPV